MDSKQNLIEIKTGHLLLKKPLVIATLVVAALLIGYISAVKGLIIPVLMIVSFCFLIFAVFLFRNPSTGLFAVIIVSFFAIGLTRYIDAPFGLSVDALCVLTFIAIMFKYFRKDFDWSPAWNDLTLLALIWYLYVFMEFFNPHQIVFQAWFTAMRGVALYFLLLVPLTFLLFNKYSHLKKFLYVWGALSILGSLKGIMQQQIGFDPFEYRWLMGPALETHVLFGKIRYFSFFSDANAFGGAQGQASVIGAIIAMNTKNKKDKIFFWIMSLLGIYGMFISGTRGSMAVPVIGFTVYLVLIKNIRLIIIGGAIGIAFYIFFAFTTIGQGNYNIARMRTAFTPGKDASNQVRADNRKKLKVFLQDKPFGTGIGTAGNSAIRYRPNSFLANTPTDGWFTQIWVEAGIIGLTLHLFILFYILGKSSYLILFKLKNPEIRGKMMAMVSALAGVIVASYSGTIIAQMPTGMLNYISMAFLFMAPKLEKELSQKSEIEIKIQL